MFTSSINAAPAGPLPSQPGAFRHASHSAFVAVVPSNAGSQAAPVARQAAPGCTATGSAYVSETMLRVMSRDFGMPSMVCLAMKALSEARVSFDHYSVGPLLRDTLQALGEDQRFAAHVAAATDSDGDDATGYAQAMEAQAHAYLDSLNVLYSAVLCCSHDFPGRSVFLSVSTCYLQATAQIPSAITLPAAAHGWMNWQASALLTAWHATSAGQAVDYPALWAAFALESPGLTSKDVRESLWRLAIEGPVPTTDGQTSPMTYDGPLVRGLRAGVDAEQVIGRFRISDQALAQWVRNSAPAYAAAGPAATPSIEQALDLLGQLCQPQEHAQQPPARNARLTLPP